MGITLSWIRQHTVPVATENRIRAGADVAIGYPRFGMLDLLKLLSGFARRTVQIACGSRGRNGISPPAAAVVLKA